MEQIDIIMEAFKGRFIETDDTSSLALLMELQQELFKMKQAEMKKTVEVLDLKKQEKLIFREGSYYKGSNGPFCPNCWEKENRLVLMEVTPRKIRKIENAECPECGTVLLSK